MDKYFYRKSMWRFVMSKGRSISNKKLLSIAGLGWMFDAMDVGMLSFIIAALQKEWNLSVQEMGWIGSINSIGMAVGAFVFGLLSDRIGRKHVFIITLLLFSLGSGASAFTNTLSIFLILRFLIGMGLGGELPVASTLVSESVPTEKRGRIVVLLESFWAFGWLLAAVISYFIIPQFGWKIALLISVIPAFYALYLRLHLPDSKRFTKVKQKNSMLKNVASVWSRKFTQKTLMLWLPSVMVMKGFSMIKSFEYVLIMTLAQLPGYFTAAWFIEKIGRKFVLVVYLIGTAVSAFLFGNADTLFMLILTGILLSFFNLGAWGALYAYTPEQYPTSIRGTGTGMATSFGRIGGILGPLLVPYLIAQNISITIIFTIFCISILIGAASVLFLGIETKNTEIE